MSGPSGQRVAVITGAGRGIGAAIARRLHADGLWVAALDIDLDSADRLARELDGTGETALAVRVDVASVEQVDAAIAAVEDRWQGVDVLVNNAARTVPKSIWDIPVDEWDGVLATNLRSALVATRRCAPGMRERGWGRVVNLASLAGQQGGLVAGGHYAAAKAGLLVLTKIFAKELAADGVTVNAVAPAAVRTPVMDDMDPEALAASESGIPVGRFGHADEVAGAVAYLCGADAGYVTGATLDINGGVFMR